MKVADFDARFFARLLVYHFGLKSVSLGPPQIHPQQHLGPVLRVGPARARVDSDDRIARVVGPRKQHLCFGLFDLLLEPRKQRFQLFDRAFVFGGELYQHRSVFDIALEAVGLFDCGVKSAAAAQHFLCALLIVPEIGFRGLFFYAFELGALGFGVKETSATRRRALTGLRVLLSTPQSSSSFFLFHSSGNTDATAISRLSAKQATANTSP